MTQAKIQELHIYPVKSLRGISLQKSELLDTGLKYDRHWMVTMDNGRFVTQRQLPIMSQIQTQLTDSGLTLTFQGQDPISIPFELDGDSSKATVWRDECDVVDQGQDISQWLSDYIKIPNLKLVKLARGFDRPQSKPDLLGEETHTHFADAAPLLVANSASLESLNQTLVEDGFEPVPMNRFRPNIVLSGLPAFAEHEIDSMRGDSANLSFCYPCERCVMTTVDQDTGKKHPKMEPYNTLARINPMPGKTTPAFGVNVTSLNNSDCELAVGEVLTSV